MDTPDPETDPVIVTRVGAVTLIRINRPARRNAADRATSFAVAAAIDAADRDPAVGAIVLTGTGERAFCSGMDLKEAETDGAGTGLVPGAGFLGLTERHFSKPVIAAVNGAAVAGGLEAMLACDLVVTHPGAVFGLPEIKRGMVAFTGGVQRLAQMLPRQAAMEIILTGRYLSAEEMRALGLINRIVPAADVVPEALRLAEEILENSWSCLRLAKDLHTVARDGTLSDAIAWGHAHGAELMHSSDSREGISAYNARRAAQFANGN